MTRSAHQPVEPVVQLRRLLRSGEWPIGSKIPNDAALAERFSAQQSAVREAVRGLVHAGLLESRPGRGTFVKAASELRGALGERAKDELTLHAIEAREALESYAVRLAATRITDAQLQELREVLEGRGRATDLAAMTREDIRFHRLIVAATGNSFMVELYEGLDQGLVFDFSGLRDLSPEESLQDDHEEVLKALASRDPELCARAVGRLLAHVRRKVLP